jgi:hypothetical protein
VGLAWVLACVADEPNAAEGGNVDGGATDAAQDGANLGTPVLTVNPAQTTSMPKAARWWPVSPN